MKDKKKNKKNLAKRLIHKYKLMIVDEDINRKKLSFRLNLMNVLLLFSLLILIIIGLTYLTLVYSPLRQYFVNEPMSQSDSNNRKELLLLNERIAKIEDSLMTNQLYIENLRAVITGKVKAAEVDTQMIAKQVIPLEDQKLKPSAEDSLFRQQIAQEEMKALDEQTETNAPQLLFTPLKGVITSQYNVAENHLAIDIAAQQGEGIKAVEDGIVVFSDWTADTGYVVILRHSNDMLSVYKHCSKVYKNIGEPIEKGDVIAAVGDTGELTTGPHLHFELWVQGNAVDPESYIDF